MGGTEPMSGERVAAIRERMERDPLTLWTTDTMRQVLAELDRVQGDLERWKRLAAQETHAWSAQMGRADRAEAALARVTALHVESSDSRSIDGKPICGACSGLWPCGTIRAAEGQDVQGVGL